MDYDSKNLKLEELISAVIRGSIEAYKIIQIDCNVAINFAQEFPIAGGVFQVLNCVNSQGAQATTAYFNVRFNSPDRNDVPFFYRTRLVTPFKSFWISYPSQDAIFTIAIGREFEPLFRYDFFFKPSAAPPAGGGYGLPFTGQVTVYQADDDGTYQKGYTLTRPIVKGAVGNTRFVDNGDNTVTDLATGLMWVKDPVNTFPFNLTCNWVTAITRARACAEGGYDDWRLPNIKELLTIYDHAEPVAIDAGIFTIDHDYYYWSSTTYIATALRAWNLWFTTGGLPNYPLKTATTYKVWPVRGGLP